MIVYFSKTFKEKKSKEWKGTWNENYKVELWQEHGG